MRVRRGPGSMRIILRFVVPHGTRDHLVTLTEDTSDEGSPCLREVRYLGVIGLVLKITLFMEEFHKDPA